MSTYYHEKSLEYICCDLYSLHEGNINFQFNYTQYALTSMVSTFIIVEPLKQSLSKAATSESLL